MMSTETELWSGGTGHGAGAVFSKAGEILAFLLDSEGHLLLSARSLLHSDGHQQKDGLKKSFVWF